MKPEKLVLVQNELFCISRIYVKITPMQDKNTHLTRTQSKDR